MGRKQETDTSAVRKKNFSSTPDARRKTKSLGIQISPGHITERNAHTMLSLASGKLLSLGEILCYENR